MQSILAGWSNWTKCTLIAQDMMTEKMLFYYDFNTHSYSNSEHIIYKRQRDRLSKTLRNCSNFNRESHSMKISLLGFRVLGSDDHIS